MPHNSSGSALRNTPRASFSCFSLFPPVCLWASIFVRLGFGHLVAQVLSFSHDLKPVLILSMQAASVLKIYTAHLESGLAKAVSSHLSLDRPLYPCAAVAAAAKLAGEKPDISKCAELGRCKRKEVVDVLEEMVKAAPDSKNGPSVVLE